jgi:hypothetical protein
MGNNNKQLQQQLTQMQTQFQQLLAKANEKTPAQTAQNQEVEGWQKFQADPTRDYTTYKPINFNLGAAARRAELAKRTATGGVGLGEINPAMATQLRQQSEDRQNLNDGLNLEQNVGEYDSTMRNETAQVAAGDEAHNQNMLGMGASMYQNALQNYYQFYKHGSSIWSKLGKIAGIAAPILASTVTGGLSLGGLAGAAGKALPPPNVGGGVWSSVPFTGFKG